MMALGSLFALVSVAFVLPGLSLLGTRDADPRRAWGEDGLDVGLGRLMTVVLRRPKTIAIATLLITAAVGLGGLWLEVETDFTRNFRSSSSVVKSYALVESNLGGAGVWDVYVPAPEKLSPEYLAKIRRLQRRLRTEIKTTGPEGSVAPGLTKVISLVDALDALDKMPLSFLRRFVPAEAQINLLNRQMPGIVPALRGVERDGGQHYYRIMLRSAERQPSQQKRQLIDDVTRISREEFAEAQVTGFFVLLTNIIDSLVRDQWLTFAVASGVIGLMMLVAFRSPALAVVAMIPNLLPMFLVTGVMGWLGLKINMGAAMIAAVSVGLSVDSSTHYIKSFLQFRGQDKGLEESLHLAHQSAGRAMTFSTLALFVGFSALCFSQFVPIIYFGALMCLSMLGGLAGNLVVLPLLLRLVSGDRRPRPSPMPAGSSAVR